jgi:hypothetical protein
MGTYILSGHSDISTDLSSHVVYVILELFIRFILCDTNLFLLFKSWFFFVSAIIMEIFSLHEILHM